MQGFPPPALSGLGKCNLLRTTGNAMSMPAMAHSVLARLLNGLGPDAGLHMRWRRAEELFAMAAVRASKLQHLHALAELGRLTRSGVSWQQAPPPPW